MTWVAGDVTFNWVEVVVYAHTDVTPDELLRGGTRLGFTETVQGLQAGSFSGTILYIAPEVLEGNPATARSDAG